MRNKLLFGLLLFASCASGQTYLKEVQITFDGTKNHVLDNNDNFSPDGKWLVYDTRTGIGGIGGSPSVERVNIETGKIEVLFGISDNHGAQYVLYTTWPTAISADADPSFLLISGLNKVRSTVFSIPSL